MDLQALGRFHLDDDAVLIRPAGEHVLISVSRDDLEAQEWDDGSGHLAALAPLRAELLAGDLRLFSLLWLVQVENGQFADEAIEPAPGLTRVSGALAALAEFLAVDPDLVQAATATATPLAAGEPSPTEIEASIRMLPEAEKVALLMRLHSGGDPHLGAELRRRCRKPGAPGDVSARAERRASCVRPPDASRKSAPVSPRSGRGASACAGKSRRRARGSNVFPRWPGAGTPPGAISRI
jgi:hypothetical protein